jgi:hypothetical protein
LSKLDKPSSWGNSAVTPVRFATEEDLLKMVELESTSYSNTIFHGTELLFSPETIRKYFRHCPKAFRVVYQGSLLVGFSIIYPLNQQGVADLRQNAPLSILSMNLSSLHTQFDDHIKAIYLEDVATRPEAPNVVRLSLLKDLVKTIQQYQVPLYATPITSFGMNLINRHGFVPLKEEGFGRIYVNKGGSLLKKDRK